jgi:cobalt-zinc-cadmium resistance protein CzcA
MCRRCRPPASRKMFRPMALTVVFALPGSLILSLTFIPALTLVLRGPVSMVESPIIRVAKRWHVGVPVCGAAVGALVGGGAVGRKRGHHSVPRRGVHSRPTVRLAVEAPPCRASLRNRSASIRPQRDAATVPSDERGQQDRSMEVATDPRCGCRRRSLPSPRDTWTSAGTRRS